MARTLGQINAMANITSQTENQRNVFASKENAIDVFTGLTKGKAGNLSGIFPSLDANEINNNAYENMKSQFVFTSNTSQYNPDFATNTVFLNYLYNNEAPNIYSLTTAGGEISLADDKPSLMGPNLKTIGFNSDGSPNIPDEFTNLNRSNPGSPNNINIAGKQGFGVFYNNVNILGSRFANYLSNKFDDDENNNPVLGQSKHGTYQ